MSFELGYFLVGVLLICVAGVAARVKRLPLTETMIYFGAGVAIGPIGFGAVSVDAQGHAKLLERLTEAGVLLSLFTAGLKLRVPFKRGRWKTPLRLAFLSMAITVGLIALAGIWLFGFSLGAAILLGAILSPTDPVLASEVQLEDAHDQDRLRFSLTGEAGLNDGTAFPFVMLGLGLLGLHELGDWGWRWWAVDVVWAVAAGLGVGALLGTLTARLVLWLRREHKEGLGRDEFIALGLIGLSYGSALLLHAYGFLAVFAAGLALRTIERKHSGDAPPEQVRAMEQAVTDEEVALDPHHGPAHMAGAVLNFNEQVERVLEVALVVTVGAALSRECLRLDILALIAILFFAVRPIAVLVGLIGCKAEASERALLSWFGIRGIGSVYYLMYAVSHGLSPALSHELISITLSVVAVSIVAHGITVTPLMAWYRRRSPAEKPA
ncbi:MAG TPA: sodium:proton antiporter [Methylomirabilota bacterium]|nr:sodium:proton antiporter [Methylomirabilota bacterium]